MAIVLDADGKPIQLRQTADLGVQVDTWTSDDNQAILESTCLGVQSATLGCSEQIQFDLRNGILSKRFLTVVRSSDATWILDRIKDKIAGKIVVELGAGIGVLAVALAAHAKHVFAIEADPMWSWVFSRWLYQSKPTNLTYIFDRGENLVDVIRGDVAIVVTGSATDELRALGAKLAAEVILPWQDFRPDETPHGSWRPV